MVYSTPLVSYVILILLSSIAEIVADLSSPESNLYVILSPTKISNLGIDSSNASKSLFVDLKSDAK